MFTRVPSPRYSPPGQLNLIVLDPMDIIFLAQTTLYNSRAMKADALVASAGAPR